MIAVCITTYNHEAFIAQAIESVLVQQCDEPIRIYIGDDSSVDNTQTICEHYAAKDKRIVYIRRKKNIGLVANTIDLYRRITADKCDYIAMLDGDDYWTDECKLQLQVDYLRKYPEVGFVHTNGSTLSGSDKWTFGQREGVYGIDSPGFANCTVIFRTNLLNNNLLKAIEAQHFMWLDYPLYGVFYQQTKCAYLPQKTAVWRDHESVSQPKSAETILKLREEKCRMWKWLDDQYPGQVGYSEQEARDYLYEQRMNLIYQFNDRAFVTEELLNDYKPRKWKQWIKQKGLKSIVIYAILQKIL
ncbi:MAG: glycosyltransferase [Paludibacteraceae bacterium]|nr:glycosyltransferase [Paludibacteraceae bacterium]